MLQDPYPKLRVAGNHQLDANNLVVYPTWNYEETWRTMNLNSPGYGKLLHLMLDTETGRRKVRTSRCEAWELSIPWPLARVVAEGCRGCWLNLVISLISIVEKCFSMRYLQICRFYAHSCWTVWLHENMTVSKTGDRQDAHGSSPVRSSTLVWRVSSSRESRWVPRLGRKYSAEWKQLLHRQTADFAFFRRLLKVVFDTTLQGREKRFVLLIHLLTTDFWKTKKPCYPSNDLAILRPAPRTMWRLRCWKASTTKSVWPLATTEPLMFLAVLCQPGV